MKKSSFIELYQEKRRPIQHLDIRITMENKNKNEQPVDELLEKVDISKCMSDHYDSIILSKLLTHLQLNYNIPLEDREITYYFEEGDIFINCGIFPVGEDIRIELKDINPQTFLHLKAKDLGLLHIDRLMYTQNTISNIENDKDEASDDENPDGKGKKGRRTKERRIGYIIEKVIQWRKYYSGTSDQNFQHQKYSLEEAADKVKISKKSLDDYLFQIRFGHRYGFNFNQHSNEKVGILRDFVRQQKKASNKGEVKRRKKTKKEGREDNDE